ncbi:hypothetical protein EI94DRAFT_1747090, partial [Lactarius quietus]
MHTPPFVCLSFVVFLFAIRSSAPHARFALCMSSFGDPLPTYLVSVCSLIVFLHPIPIRLPPLSITLSSLTTLPPIVVLSRKPPKKK